MGWLYNKKDKIRIAMKSYIRMISFILVLFAYCSFSILSSPALAASKRGDEEQKYTEARRRAVEDLKDTFTTMAYSESCIQKKFGRDNFKSTENRELGGRIAQKYNLLLLKSDIPNIASAGQKSGEKAYSRDGGNNCRQVIKKWIDIHKSYGLTGKDYLPFVR